MSHPSTPSVSSLQTKPGELCALGILFLAYVVLALCNGWLVDDAYITFRVSENFVNGYGARWNISERVQVYTHPLWMMLFTIAHWFTRETYYTAIFLSWIVSIICVGVVAFKLRSGFRGAVFVLLGIIMSKSFMDYSSSGLENPLTHLILTLFAFAYLELKESPRKVFFLTLAMSLAIVNRHDSILLLFPAAALTFWINRSWPALGTVLLGAVPFFLWEATSLVYYGFLVPNTAWAKLNTGLSHEILFRTAENYYLQSFMFDHVTLLVLLVSVVCSFVFRCARLWVFGIGLLLHLLYILRIGGDFMSGRFFSSAFLLALIVLSRMKWHLLPRRTYLLILASVVLAGVTNRFPTFAVNTLSGYAEEQEAFNTYRNVKDERAFYYRNTGFLAGLKRSRWPDMSWRDLGEQLRDQRTKAFSYYAIGLLGYYAGPDVHILDVMALGDPLLARLTYSDSERQGETLGVQTHPDFMPGHLQRGTPVGYMETLESGENRIENPELREYYDALCLVTKGPIWTRERWRAIWQLNTGGLDELLDRYENPSKYEPAK